MPQIHCRQVRSRGLRPDWDEVIKVVADGTEWSMMTIICEGLITRRWNYVCS